MVQNRRQQQLGRAQESRIKATLGKSILKLAQELVAKKCGIIKDDKALEKLTLQ
jgi:hypothetical protein